MWRSAHATLGWMLAAAMVFSLSLICLLQWKSLKEREHGVAAALTRGLRELDQRLDVSNSRWQSLFESTRREERSRAEAVQPTVAQGTKDDILEKDAESPVADEPVADQGNSEDLSALPPIPAGVSARNVVSRDLMEILSDPVLNPKGKKLTMVEASRAQAELVRAQSLTSILEAEIRVEYNVGMEELKAQGEFIEYAPGEKRQTFEGVVTTGEIIPGGGVRMFYLYPERFPEIYEKKRTKAEVAEAATRKILALLSE